MANTFADDKYSAGVDDDDDDNDDDDDDDDNDDDVTKIKNYIKLNNCLTYLFCKG